MQQSLLNDEKEALAELERLYKKALKDIGDKVKAFAYDISVLDAALEEEGLDDAQRKLLQSRRQAKVYQKQYQDALQGQISDVVDKLHADEYETLHGYLTECYDNAFMGTLYNIQKQGIPLMLPIDQTAAVRAVLLNSKLSAGLYARLGIDLMQMKADVSREVTRGIAANMQYRDIARNIKNVSGVTMGRGRLIARTEGHRIQQQSNYDAQQRAKGIGADVVKQWDAALDSRTRESHVAVDGEIREIDKPFSNGLMYPGDPAGAAAEVCNCRCTSNTRAKWALSAEQTKWLGDVSKMSDKQKEQISGKLGIPVDELDNYSKTIVPLNAKGFDDFKEKYKALRNPEDERIIREAEERIAGYKAKKSKKSRAVTDSSVDKLQYSGKVSSELVTTIETAVSKMPQQHRTLAETKISGIEITEAKDGNHYFPKSQKMKISVFSRHEDIVHEYGHALEYAIDVHHDPEFDKIMRKGLENLSLDDIIIDEETFSKPIYRVQHDKFISLYQGRLYEEAGIFNGEEISIDGMLEYFSEGYTEYVFNPDNLKKHDPDLFAYIERINHDES